MELNDTLRAFLETGDDWERKNTSVKGVSIIKLPGTKSRAPSLAIEINPVGEKGIPMKKKGVMVMSGGELRAFQEIFSNPKVDGLIRTIEDISPGKKGQKGGSGDILEI
ncbi:MAG: hypothetical protein A4E38_00755 [Methanoregulaceae archaeon PtaB.Bin108]|nr:MAG: hypothetical protein A4E38_00755 [Methanoregulaceae archaeon PtaB.Bin108]